MSTTETPVDVTVLRDEIQKTYTEVSTEQDREFIFPTGRAWAEDLDYPQLELARVPDASVASFAGVANPFSLGRIEPGKTVLDLGCGAGTDLLIAAQMAGPEGRVIGVDMTPTTWVFQPGALCPATKVRLERDNAWLEFTFNALTGNVDEEKAYFP